MERFGGKSVHKSELATSRGERKKRETKGHTNTGRTQTNTHRHRQTLANYEQKGEFKKPKENSH